MLHIINNELYTFTYQSTPISPENVQKQRLNYLRMSNFVQLMLGDIFCLTLRLNCSVTRVFLQV
jgi:hypothetical protein